LILEYFNPGILIFIYCILLNVRVGDNLIHLMDRTSIQQRHDIEFTTICENYFLLNNFHHLFFHLQFSFTIISKSFTYRYTANAHKKCVNMKLSNKILSKVSNSTEFLITQYTSSKNNGIIRHFGQLTCNSHRISENR